MAWKLTLSEINEYKAAFNLFDTDQDGKILTEEMGLLMRSLGQNFSNAELKEITKDIVNKKDINYLEFHEFLEIMAKNRRENEDQIKLIKAFRYFDKDNSGLIKLLEFKHVMTTIAEKLTEEETDKLEEIAQVDSEGRFNYINLVKSMIFK